MKNGMEDKNRTKRSPLGFTMIDPTLGLLIELFQICFW